MNEEIIYLVDYEKEMVMKVSGDGARPFTDKFVDRQPGWRIVNRREWQRMEYRIAIREELRLRQAGGAIE